MSIQGYNYNNILPLGEYPFFDYSKTVLQDYEISIERIDKEPLYDEIIGNIVNDIINSFKSNKITPLGKMNNSRYEVIKFYLSLFILKSMPSRLMYRYWIKAYMSRFATILDRTLRKNPAFKTISVIFDELHMPHKFVNIQGVNMMAIKVNDYLDFAVEINQNDKTFNHLTLVNMPLHKGRVFIPLVDLENFRLIILKLAEIRIYGLLEGLDLQARSTKVDAIVKDLQGYIVKDPNVNEKLTRQQAEYGEISPQMQIVNDKTIQMFKNLPSEINISQFPPCVNRLLNKILHKQVLGHPENILLAAYCASKGFTKEQMMDIFMTATNADKKKIDYNLGYVLEKQLKPYNCNKADEYHLCYKDEFCIKYELTNPMGYRK